MKRHTKKGPRRSAQMPVSTKRFVVTDYDGCGYITAGKTYLAKSLDDRLLVISCRRKGDVWIMSPDSACGCTHINDNKWRWATL